VLHYWPAARSIGRKTDEEIIDATMGELARLFPAEIAKIP
jgi:hypothetical protein